MSKTKFSASRYRTTAASRRPVEKTFEVELPSGDTWELRKPHLETFVLSNQLPLSLAEKMAKSKAAGVSDEEAFQSLDFKEQIKAIEFSTKLVRHICVIPRIVDEPETDEEIAPEDILPEDFAFLVEWASSGGAEADGLDSFRSERQKPAVGGSMPKRNRHKSQ